MNMNPTSEELASKANSWTLACDDALLKQMKSLAENIYKDSEEILMECRAISNEIDALSCKLSSSTNKFLMLPNNHFVENCVQDFREQDVYSASSTDSKPVIKKTKLELQNELIEKMKLAFRIGSKSIENHNCAKASRQPKIYPHVIGTSKFFSSRLCGLENVLVQQIETKNVPTDSNVSEDRNVVTDDEQHVPSTSALDLKRPESYSNQTHATRSDLQSVLQNAVLKTNAGPTNVQSNISHSNNYSLYGSNSTVRQDNQPRYSPPPLDDEEQSQYDDEDVVLSRGRIFEESEESDEEFAFSKVFASRTKKGSVDTNNTTVVKPILNNNKRDVRVSCEESSPVNPNVIRPAPTISKTFSERAYGNEVAQVKEPKPQSLYASSGGDNDVSNSEGNQTQPCHVKPPCLDKSPNNTKSENPSGRGSQNVISISHENGSFPSSVKSDSSDSIEIIKHKVPAGAVSIFPPLTSQLPIKANKLANAKSDKPPIKNQSSQPSPSVTRKSPQPQSQQRKVCINDLFGNDESDDDLFASSSKIFSNRASQNKLFEPSNDAVKRNTNAERSQKNNLAQKRKPIRPNSIFDDLDSSDDDLFTKPRAGVAKPIYPKRKVMGEDLAKKKNKLFIDSSEEDEKSLKSETSGVKENNVMNAEVKSETSGVKEKSVMKAEVKSETSGVKEKSVMKAEVKSETSGVNAEIKTEDDAVRLKEETNRDLTKNRDPDTENKLLVDRTDIFSEYGDNKTNESAVKEKLISSNVESLTKEESKEANQSKKSEVKHESKSSLSCSSGMDVDKEEKTKKEVPKLKSKSFLFASDSSSDEDLFVSLKKKMELKKKKEEKKNDTETVTDNKTEEIVSANTDKTNDPEKEMPLASSTPENEVPDDKIKSEVKKPDLKEGLENKGASLDQFNSEKNCSHKDMNNDVRDGLKHPTKTRENETENSNAVEQTKAQKEMTSVKNKLENIFKNKDKDKKGVDESVPVKKSLSADSEKNREPEKKQERVKAVDKVNGASKSKQEIKSTVDVKKLAANLKINPAMLSGSKTPKCLSPEKKDKSKVEDVAHDTPKAVETADVEAERIVQIEKGVDAESAVILPSLLKTRPKIQSRRKPPSRALRLGEKDDVFRDSGPADEKSSPPEQKSVDCTEGGGAETPNVVDESNILDTGTNGVENEEKGSAVEVPPVLEVADPPNDSSEEEGNINDSIRSLNKNIFEESSDEKESEEVDNKSPYKSQKIFSEDEEDDDDLLIPTSKKLL